MFLKDLYHSQGHLKLVLCGKRLVFRKMMKYIIEFKSITFEDNKKLSSNERICIQSVKNSKGNSNNALKIYSYRKHCEKMRNCLYGKFE